MIELIEISHFQGHKYSLLDLSPGVNVIKGQSHKGKSSIIRALVWAILNRPRGDGFRSWLARPRDSVEVGIQMNNGFVVRERSSTKNGYHYEGNDLAAVKSEVPTEIQNILQMEDVNISSQFDLPFLLSDSAGDVARNFQNCVGLDIIDKIIKKIKQMTRQYKSEVKRLDESIKEKTEEIRSLSWIDQAGKDIEILQEFESGLKQKTTSVNGILEIFQEAQVTKAYIKGVGEWLKIEPDVNNLIDLVEQKHQKRIKKAKINGIVTEIDLQKYRFKQLDKKISIESDVDSCIILNERLSVRLIQRSKMVNLCTDIGKAQNSLRKRTQEAEDTKRTFEAEMKKAGICPLCDQKYARRIKIR